jgi:beta-glucosidase
VMGNALTQTWNRDLIAAQFKAVGEEYFGTGHNMVDGALLGPLGRVPEGMYNLYNVDGLVLHELGGRQNEAFSPDPYLSGISVAAGVKGQQEAGVIAGVRHFLLYEQETNRMSGGGGGGGGGMSGAPGGNSTSTNSTTSTDDLEGSASVSSAAATSTSSQSSSSGVYSSNADDKTLHEVYMWPWGDAIQAGTVAVMCAMPLVNGTHSCENNELLSVKLKEELGFPGLVYPDESAQFSSYDSANAGLDYSPYSDGLWTQTTLAAGIANGSLSEERLDDMAIRSVLPYFFVGLDTADLPETGGYTDWRDVRGNHSTLIRQIGGEAISLLKNNNANGGGLPLNKPHSLSLYGSHAGPAQAGKSYAIVRS